MDSCLALSTSLLVLRNFTSKFLTVVFDFRLASILPRTVHLSRVLGYMRHMANHSPNFITVPDGFTLHTENTSHILLPSNNEAFLNPVQEFNRDLSVAAIRVWSEELNRTKEERWRQARERRLMRTEKRKRPKVDKSAEQET